MRHPLRNIPNERRKAIFIVLLVSTLLAMVVMYITGRPLFIDDIVPKGIISYELAGTEENAQKILDSWDDLAKVYAGFNLGFDYLFIVLYSSTIALAIIWLVDLLAIEGKLMGFALLLATGLSVAAFLDAIENVALFAMLVNGVSSPWPQVAFVTASIKFGLILMGLGFVIVGYIIYLFRSSRRSS